MHRSLSQHLMDSFFGGVTPIGDLLIVSKGQPVAELEGGDCYLYHPLFFEQFDGFQDQLIPTIDENGDYSLLLLGDEYEIVKAVPRMDGWSIAIMDPSAPEEALVRWTEKFTLS